MTELTKRSKAAFYKHRLEKCLVVLKEVKIIIDDDVVNGIEDIYGLQEKLNEINYRIEDILEDLA